MWAIYCIACCNNLQGSGEWTNSGTVCTQVVENKRRRRKLQQQALKKTKFQSCTCAFFGCRSAMHGGPKVGRFQSKLAGVQNCSVIIFQFKDDALDHKMQ